MTCHNSATLEGGAVLFPSYRPAEEGEEVTGVVTGMVSDGVVCMNCHQGRESKVSVDEAIAELGLGADDTSEELGFRNVHYAAAAATLYGTFVKGGYEYDGMTYDAQFAHVEGVDICQDCHDTHSLEVKAEGCVMCHGEGEFADYRMLGSMSDYDGDGDMEEGIYYEIEGLQNYPQQALFTMRVHTPISSMKLARDTPVGARAC